ncbi:thioesterase domain-containing protein [Pseudomonas aeruginosa]|nr:thioesterase domain-containing protein [Pseudomonas aeruginosa]
MLCAIDDALLPLLDRPFALVGASLDGMLAYELAARLESLHGLRARQLFVISSRARGRTWNTRASMRWATPSCCEPCASTTCCRWKCSTTRSCARSAWPPCAPIRALAADYRYRPREPLACRSPRSSASRTRASPGRPSTAGGGTPAATSWRPWPAATGVVTAAEEVCAILRQRLAPDVPGGVPANLAT